MNTYQILAGLVGPGYEQTLSPYIQSKDDDSAVEQAMRFCMNRIHALSTIDAQRLGYLDVVSAELPTIDEKGELVPGRRKTVYSWKEGWVRHVGNSITGKCPEIQTIIADFYMVPCPILGLGHKVGVGDD